MRRDKKTIIVKNERDNKDKKTIEGMSKTVKNTLNSPDEKYMT